MRNLKYAILGLLKRRPMTGYDIKTEFSSSLGNFWSAHHSQIYPELARLAEEKLVTFDTVIQGEVMEKKLYTITPAGEEDFAAWMALRDELAPTPRDVFRLKSYFSENWSPAEMTAHLRYQISARTRKLRGLEELIEGEYGGCDPAALTPAQRGDYMTMRGGVLREKAYLRWLRECLAMM